MPLFFHWTDTIYFKIEMFQIIDCGMHKSIISKHCILHNYVQFVYKD